MFQKNVAGQHVHIEAFDAATGLQKTGDSANITIYYQQGNLSSALGTVTALADTTINESSSSNAKGTYWGNLSQGETNCDELNITAKSATGNITITARRYNTVAPNMNKVSVDSNGRLDVIKLAGTTQTAKDVGAALPAAAPGAANGLLIAGTNAAVALLNFTGNMTGNVSGSLGSLTTNNDKTGYRLSGTGVDDIWDEPMTDHNTSFTAGDELQQSFTQILTYLDAAVSSRSSHSASDVWASGTRTLTAGTNIQLPSNGLANVTAWTVALTGNLSGSVGSVTTVSDKTGYALTSAYDFAKGTVVPTESYAAHNSVPTPIQALMEMLAMLTEKSVASTTLTTKKRDGSTTARTYSLNDATTPTAITGS